jgi:hypothetical protein
MSMIPRLKRWHGCSALIPRLRASSPAAAAITPTGGSMSRHLICTPPIMCCMAWRRHCTVTGSAFAQSLRLPGSRNTKPARANALCRVLELRDQRYPLRAFQRWLPVPTRSASRIHRSRTPQTVRADAIARISAVLTAAGYRRSGDWLNGACPFPERHRHGDRHPSFGFSTRTGYGFCHVCGTLPLRELCLALGISSVS